jgi:hypothetical protein
MPSDVSVEIASRSIEARPARRLPLGVGLSVGAFASVALWTCIGFALRALFV